ncbi:MAG TPA: hypothetical protein P5295_11270 [Spirochaetota bacterium]|nr:hypothetical protein [Spirochaetota bacterium]
MKCKNFCRVFSLIFLSAIIAVFFFFGCDDGGGSSDSGKGGGLTVNAGSDRYVETGEHVALDGSRTRSDGATIESWSWVQTSGPSVTLADADTARPSFDAPAEDADPSPVGETLVFTLTVKDSAGREGSATNSVQVLEASGIEPTTSGGKILKALNQGDIDLDTAVRYLAFSLYENDTRLPEEYRGEREHSASWVTHLLKNELEFVSPATQEIVEPFLVPPSSSGSNFSQNILGYGGAFQMDVIDVSTGWNCEEREHVAVWYHENMSNGAVLAYDVANEAEAKIWPRLKIVWGEKHVPIISGNPQDLSGMQGKLNIFFVDGLGSDGLETPYGEAPALTWIQLDARLPYSGRPSGLIEALAHEMTHSCQDTYEQSGNYEYDKWIFEGIATWAEDDVYPATNTEHEYSSLLLNSLDKPLDYDVGNRVYATYLFFKYVTSIYNDKTIVRRVFENFQTKSALDSVDSALPKGFADAWPLFLEAAWNHGTNGWFKSDSLDDEALSIEGKEPAVIDMAIDKDLSFNEKVTHLSGNYHHFVMNDNQRYVVFYDGLSCQLDKITKEENGDSMYKPNIAPGIAINPVPLEGAAVRVMTMKNNVWSNSYTFKNFLGVRRICRDMKSNNFDEIVIIFGNSTPKKDNTLTKPDIGYDSRLWITNIGCYRWRGSASADKVNDGWKEINATSSTIEWESVIGGYYSLPNVFKLNADIGSWIVSGSSPDGECTVSGSDNWNITTPILMTIGLEFISGESYRAFMGGSPSKSIEYTKECSESGQTTEGAILQPFTTQHDACDSEGYPRISSDGTSVSSSFSCNDSSGDEVQYNWSFSSSKEQ